MDLIITTMIRAVLLVIGSILLLPVTIAEYAMIYPKPQVVPDIHRVFSGRHFYSVILQPTNAPMIMLVLMTFFNGLLLILLALAFNGLVYTINKDTIDYQYRAFFIVDKNIDGPRYYLVKLKRAIMAVVMMTVGILLLSIGTAVICFFEQYIPAVVLTVLSILLLYVVTRDSFRMHIKSSLISNVIAISILIITMLVFLSNIFRLQF